MLDKLIYNRPLGVWLILLYTAFNALGSGKNVAVELSKTQSQATFGIGYIVWGTVFLLLGLWLMAELWVNGPRQKMAILTNLGAYLLMYLSAAAANFVIYGPPAVVVTLITGSIMTLIWYLSYLYLKKIGR